MTDIPASSSIVVQLMSIVSGIAFLLIIENIFNRK